MWLFLLDSLAGCAHATLRPKVTPNTIMIISHTGRLFEWNLSYAS